MMETPVASVTSDAAPEGNAVMQNQLVDQPVQSESETLPLIGVSQTDENSVTNKSIRRPRRDDDMVYAFAVVDDVDEPRTLSEALRRSDAQKWQEAINDEYSSLMRNGTWDLVSRRAQKVISSKWVFKIKRDEKNEPVRYKARLVARGFDQIKGVDFFDCSSPTVSSCAVRMLIATASKRNWDISHLDVKTAFLHGVLKERVYMEQPEGFVQVELVCHLRKTLEKQLSDAQKSLARANENEKSVKRKIQEKDIFIRELEKRKMLSLRSSKKRKRALR